ncbi:MAG: 30S ribosome-binding factor RbfA [bacterium]
MAKRFTHGKGPSQRQLRAGELLRHALVEILQREDMGNALLRQQSVTITQVRPSADLRHASVFCTTLGGVQEKETVAALNEVASRMRGILGGKIEMKFTPELKFLRDQSFEEAERIDTLLARDDVRRDLEVD